MHCNAVSGSRPTIVLIGQLSRLDLGADSRPTFRAKLGKLFVPTFGKWRPAFWATNLGPRFGFPIEKLIGTDFAALFLGPKNGPFLGPRSWSLGQFLGDFLAPK